jgi:hypothetical protein
MGEYHKFDEVDMSYNIKWGRVEKKKKTVLDFSRKTGQKDIFSSPEP